MQIKDRSGSRGRLARNDQLRGSGGQKSRSHEAEERFGGLAEASFLTQLGRAAFLVSLSILVSTYDHWRCGDDDGTWFGMHSQRGNSENTLLTDGVQYFTENYQCFSGVDVTLWQRVLLSNTASKTNVVERHAETAPFLVFAHTTRVVVSRRIWRRSCEEVYS